MGGFAGNRDGTGNPLGNSMMRMGSRFGGVLPSETRPGTTYAPVTPNVYGSAFNSQQSAQAPQAGAQTPSVSPIVQQMAQRIQAQNNPFASGLQSLYSQFNIPQPTMAPRAPVQMPVYQNPALAYRPNIQQVQQNLSRVKPSVYKTDLDAARARIAELEAAEQARNAASDTGYYSGG